MADDIDQSRPRSGRVLDESSTRRNEVDDIFGHKTQNEATDDGTLIQIVKRLRTLLSGVLTVSGEAWTGVEKTVAVAGDQTVKASAGKVSAIRAIGADVTVKDGATVVWKVPTGGSDHFPQPINFATNITLTFSAAGSAYVVYK
jgi:hypothetical protein